MKLGSSITSRQAHLKAGSCLLVKIYSDLGIFLFVHSDEKAAATASNSQQQQKRHETNIIKGV